MSDRTEDQRFIPLNQQTEYRALTQENRVLRVQRDALRAALQELFDLQTTSMAPGDWAKEFKAAMQHSREVLKETAT